ncbi:MAG: S41 family peptidase [Patescibacteria group bacterium]|nr:S41 family peptidase [Patescibacteria group bacterium]
MKKRVLEITIVAVLGVALLGSGFWLGWTTGRKYPTNLVITGVGSSTLAQASSVADFSIFWQAWQDINDLYLRNPDISSTAKVYGAVNGLVQSLGDPYTEFFAPADSQQFQQNIQGSFGGIGAELGGNLANEIVIIAPLKGSPAEAAGLKPGDIILGVNGSSTADMTVDQAVMLIRGPVGQKVTLTIGRTGWNAPKDFTITRQTVQVPLVDFEMKGDIAHISVHQFDQETGRQFYNALVQAVNHNAKGIVLDLRGDPGGYLEVAVELAGYFLKPGSLVVKEVGRAVPEQDFTSSGNGALANLPMAVLIDSGSASASEILAGALHDDRKIPLVGTKSFGKGTVQELEQLSDGSSIKITVAHWVMPSGLIIDHKGIMPDYAVTLTDQDIQSKNDTQLAKALQVVQAEIDGKPLPTPTPVSSTASSSSS